MEGLLYSAEVKRNPKPLPKSQNKLRDQKSIDQYIFFPLETLLDKNVGPQNI